jgi:hypothetical protein
VNQTKYHHCRDLIRDGDLALFRNGGIQSLLAGPSTYTHVGKLFFWVNPWDGERTLYLAEQREFRGGRIVTLSSQVRRFPGKIDIWRPNCGARVACKSAQMVGRQAGHDYGYGSVWRAFVMKLSLLRLVIGYMPDTTDETASTWDELKHCSQTVCWAERVAGRKEGFNPAPRIGDKWCLPNDLANASHTKMWEGLVL